MIGEFGAIHTQEIVTQMSDWRISCCCSCVRGKLWRESEPQQEDILRSSCLNFVCLFYSDSLTFNALMSGAVG